MLVGYYFFLGTLVVAAPSAAHCSGSVLCNSLYPLTAAMGDPERGRGGWINLAKRKNE